MDPGADDGSAAGQRAKRQWDESTNRSEQDGRVELFRWTGLGIPRPLRPEAPGELLAPLVPGAGEGEDPTALMRRHLADDVGRGSESVQADSLGITAKTQRAIADQPGAEQWRGL